MRLNAERNLKTSKKTKGSSTMTKILLETNNKDAAFDNAIGSYDTESKHDAEKLAMLAIIVNDIIGENEPSDEDLDNDDTAIELYDNIHNLKLSLEDMGYIG